MAETALGRCLRKSCLIRICRAAAQLLSNSQRPAYGIKVQLVSNQENVDSTNPILHLDDKLTFQIDRHFSSSHQDPEVAAGATLFHLLKRRGGVVTGERWCW